MRFCGIERFVNYESCQSAGDPFSFCGPFPCKHYRLDVSAGEDRCRVRHPAATTVLGILRRAVQGEYRAWARRQRKARDSTCPAFLEKMSRRGNLVVRYLTGEVSRL